MTAKTLRKWGVKEVFIPGLLVAGILGFSLTNIGINIYKNKTLFPYSATISNVIDGDTLETKTGVRVRLMGINAPDRGDMGYEGAKGRLGELTLNKKIWLEYDRYQDDQNGRILAWVWINCEASPKFTPADYMHLTYNQSKPGLMDNPDGCKKGKLVQEELIKSGNAVINVYKDRGELKYVRRLEKK